jgi:hypothetical protein
LDIIGLLRGFEAFREALALVEVAVGRLLEDLRAMADDTEPHYTMVREWLRHWAEDLAHPSSTANRVTT